MIRWQYGSTITLRNIARSDGTVTTAVPSIVLQDSNNLLATYTPQGPLFQNNWVVPPEERVASVDNITPSARRQYRELSWWHDTIRLYLAGKGFSVWLNFDEQGMNLSNDLSKIAGRLTWGGIAGGRKRGGRCRHYQRIGLLIWERGSYWINGRFKPRF